MAKRKLVQGFRFKVGLLFKVLGSGFWVQGFGFWVLSSGYDFKVFLYKSKILSHHCLFNCR